MWRPVAHLLRAAVPRITHPFRRRGTPARDSPTRGSWLGPRIRTQPRRPWRAVASCAPDTCRSSTPHPIRAPISQWGCIRTGHEWHRIRRIDRTPTCSGRVRSARQSSHRNRHTPSGRSCCVCTSRAVGRNTRHGMVCRMTPMHPFRSARPRARRPWRPPRRPCRRSCMRRAQRIVAPRTRGRRGDRGGTHTPMFRSTPRRWAGPACARTHTRRCHCIAARTRRSAWARSRAPARRRASTRGASWCRTRTRPTTARRRRRTVNRKRRTMCPRVARTPRAHRRCDPPRPSDTACVRTGRRSDGARCTHTSRRTVRWSRIARARRRPRLAQRHGTSARRPGCRRPHTPRRRPYAPGRRTRGLRYRSRPRALRSTGRRACPSLRL